MTYFLLVYLITIIISIDMTYKNYLYFDGNVKKGLLISYIPIFNLFYASFIFAKIVLKKPERS